MAISTLILYKDYRIIRQNDFTEHPGAFLSRLKVYQLNKFTIYNKLYWFYATALSLRCIFYFYEVLNNLSPALQIGIIALYHFLDGVVCDHSKKSIYQTGKRTPGPADRKI